MSMSSYEYLFGSSSSDDDEEVLSEFTEFAENAYQAHQPKRTRRYIQRDHLAAHNRLVMHTSAKTRCTMKEHSVDVSE